MSIGKKLIINTLTLSIIALSAFLIMGVSAVLTARDSFIQNKFEQFSAIREIKGTGRSWFPWLEPCR